MSLLQSIFGGGRDSKDDVRDNTDDVDASTSRSNVKTETEGRQKKKKKSSHTKEKSNAKASSSASKLFDQPAIKIVPPPKPRSTAELRKQTNERGVKRNNANDDAPDDSNMKKDNKRKRKKADTDDGKITVESDASMGIAVGPLSQEDAPAEQDQDASWNSIGNTDDAEECTVFVGNIPLSTTRKSLAHMFAECGKVASTRIRSVAVEGIKLPPQQAGNHALMKKVCYNTHKVDTSVKSSVQGYVVFESRESVEVALKLNNTQIPDPDSKSSDGTRTIRVDRASGTFDARRSVFVGNLPYQANEDTLRQHFVNVCDLSRKDVEGVRIVRDPETFKCRGFGYVLFTTRDMVSMALRYVNGTTYMKRELRVTVCGKRFKGNRGSHKEGKGSDGKNYGQGAEKEPSLGALKRLLAKKASQSDFGGKKKRARGDITKSRMNNKATAAGKKSPKATGISKRAAAEAKTAKRVKKLEKRMKKGMGKTRVK